MLNRTNRTLSANLLGLNLGTRSFAVANASVLNSGSQTLRLRHDHPDRCVDPIERDGEMRRIEPRIMGSIRPDSPGSLPASWCSSGSAWAWARVGVVAEAPPRVGAVVVGVTATFGNGLTGQARGPWQPQPQPQSPALPKPGPAPRRLKRGTAGGPGGYRGAFAAAATTSAAAPASDRNAFVPVARLRATGG